MESDTNGAIWSLPHGGELDANVVRLQHGHEFVDHVNDEVDILLVVWSGDGELVVDDEVASLRAGSVVHIARGRRRTIRARTTDLTYLSIHRRRGPLMIQPRPGSPPAATE